MFAILIFFFFAIWLNNKIKQYVFVWHPNVDKNRRSPSYIWSFFSLFIDRATQSHCMWHDGMSWKLQQNKSNQREGKGLFPFSSSFFFFSSCDSSASAESKGVGSNGNFRHTIALPFAFIVTYRTLLCSLL